MATKKWSEEAGLKTAADIKAEAVEGASVEIEEVSRRKKVPLGVDAITGERRAIVYKDLLKELGPEKGQDVFTQLSIAAGAGNPRAENYFPDVDLSSLATREVELKAALSEGDEDAASELEEIRNRRAAVVSILKEAGLSK